MELSRRPLGAAAALVAATAVLSVAAAASVPSAGAATPTKLSAKVGAATFTTTYEASKDGGKFAWKLTAPGYRQALLAVRLIVPYDGKPLALTLCTKCRSTEVGQAVVASPIAKVIAAGKSKIEIDPPQGKTVSAPLR